MVMELCVSVWKQLDFAVLLFHSHIYIQCTIGAKAPFTNLKPWSRWGHHKWAQWESVMMVNLCSMAELDSASICVCTGWYVACNVTILGTPWMFAGDKPFQTSLRVTWKTVIVYLIFLYSACCWYSFASSGFALVWYIAYKCLGVSNNSCQLTVWTLNCHFGRKKLLFFFLKKILFFFLCKTAKKQSTLFLIVYLYF